MTLFAVTPQTIQQRDGRIAVMCRHFRVAQYGPVDKVLS